MRLIWVAFSMVVATPMLAAQQTSQAIERRILEIEHARAEDASALATIAGNDVRLQRLAVRAIGRMERPELAAMVSPFLKSPDAKVRQEAASALGQLQAKVNYAELIAAERNGAVRGELFTSVGRITPAVSGAEDLLRGGLADATAEGRTGAARGLEWLLRSNRGMIATQATIDALKAAFRTNTGEIPRQLILLALNQQAPLLAANQRTGADSAIYDLALRDTSAQVRRLAVAGSRRWVADPAPMVRYQALRSANNCQRAEELLNDASGNVQLAAIDMMGDRKCDPKPLMALLDKPQGWPVRSHAIVALAKINPTPEVRALIKEHSNTPAWQARVYAATAAKIVADTHIFSKLAHNPEPNVVIEAMTTSADAIRSLASNHSGLLAASAAKLKGSPQLPAAVPQILAALDRVTKTGRATTRDERTALLARIGEAGDAATIEKLRPYLSDVDPAIAKQAATIISQKSGTTVEPITKKLATVPLPAQSFLDGLAGATATITMRGLGVITLELMMDEAPITAAKFAELADARKFDGLTFHRIVPNFVIQGGSPGADEYDGITEQFMKEEVGIPSHLRGTFGISTRGHDTGDGQIFINLIDNYRLDHQYTVFARVISGMDVVDKVQEGEVMQSVKIIRKR